MSSRKPKRLSQHEWFRHVVESAKDRESMYCFLHMFHQLCARHKICYWLDGGTLLGAIRHEGIIPWDDDLDVSMGEADFKQFKKKVVREEMKNMGIRMVPFFFGAKLYFEKGRKIPDKKFKFPFLDIFVRKLHPDQTPVDPYASDYANSIWAKCAHHKWEQLFPLRQVAYGKYLKLMIPNTTAYLDHCYGNKWAHEVVTPGWDHQLDKAQYDKEQKYDLNPDEDLPLPHMTPVYRPKKNDLPLAGTTWPTMKK